MDPLSPKQLRSLNEAYGSIHSSEEEALKEELLREEKESIDILYENLVDCGIISEDQERTEELNERVGQFFNAIRKNPTFKKLVSEPIKANLTNNIYPALNKFGKKAFKAGAATLGVKIGDDVITGGAGQHAIKYGLEQTRKAGQEVKDELPLEPKLDPKDDINNYKKVNGRWVYQK
jgi:hypothetical protein